MSDTCVRPENRYLDPQQLQHSWNLDPDAPLPSCEVENTSNSSANDWLIMLSSGRAAEACDELPGRDVEVGLEIPPLTVPSMIDATAPAPPPAFSTSSRLAWWDETNRAPAAKAESSASNDHLTGSFPSLTPTDAARFTGTTNHLSHNNYNGSRGDDLQSLPSCSFGHGASISERQPGSRKSSASDLLMDLGEIATPTSACSADFKLASKRRASVQALTQRVLLGEAHRRSNSMAMMASLAASDATMIDRGTPCDRSPSPQRSLSEQEGSFVLGRTTTGGAPPPPMIELVPGSGSTSMKGVSMASFSGMEGGRGAVPVHTRTGSASNMQVYRQHLNTKKTDALRQYRDAVKFVKERRYGWTLKEILANRHRVGMEDDDDDDDEESEEGEEEDDEAPRREEPEDEMCSTPRDDAR